MLNLNCDTPKIKPKLNDFCMFDGIISIQQVHIIAGKGSKSLETVAAVSFVIFCHKLSFLHLFL